MDKVVRVCTPEEVRQCCAFTFPPLTPETLSRRRADAHRLLLDAAHNVVASSSLWWTEVPPYPPHRLGVIGHYSAHDLQAGMRLLTLSCEELLAQGCTMAVGPMDGNTWRRYRLITDKGDEPPFFLEPDHPDGWPCHFTESGFTPLARYYSAINDDLSVQDPRTADVAKRLLGDGVILRPLQMERFEEEVSKIYQVAKVSFCNNFLYTPIDEPDFLAQYLPIRPYVRPELVLLAEAYGAPIGFIFSIPDALQAGQGKPVVRVVMKTMAVLPQYGGKGLGSLLIAKSQEVARGLGFRQTVFALMHENNASRKISAHYARVMRRYTLFGKSL